MLYLRICFDKPGLGDLRNEVRAEHREYLTPFRDPGGSVHVHQAGPMCVSDTDLTNLGSFFLLEAASAEAVRAFHEGDPFTRVGLYGEVRLVRWDRHIGNPD